MTAHAPLKGYVQLGDKIAPAETPAGYMARGETLYLTCRNFDCKRARPLDMEGLVDRGWGTVPIAQIVARLICEKCQARGPATCRGEAPSKVGSPLSQAAQLYIPRRSS